ncbi:zf-HC2 domain-containing protein [Methyloglobulus sp.]|uniref:zf-HC2 domain-containing protein n=1 Tax=Methyloglobulus sp. TaxID=2518622 RepID=UPI003988B2E0
MNKPNNAGHDFVVELLPWYAKGTLNPAEQARVAQHLPSCSECRRQLAQCRQLDDVFKGNSDVLAWRPSPTQFSRILQDIDVLESTTHTRASPVRMPGLFANLSAWLKATPSPAYWFMALETVVLVALVLLVVAQPPQQPEAQLFQTLSNERPPATATLPRLSIVFAEDITEREIRALLQTQHGQLVQGPSILGVYTVQLTAGGAHELQQTITALRGNSKVKLVEAIAGADRQ